MMSVAVDRSVGEHPIVFNTRYADAVIVEGTSDEEVTNRECRIIDESIDCDDTKVLKFIE